MSGPIPHQLASAATRLAAVARCRAIIAGHRRAKPEADSLPGRTWREMPLETRTVLVMLASKSAGDPREQARKPWESFPDGDRASIAACARQLGRDLSGAASLF